MSEADLNTCIAEAPTDNSEFTITLGADFNITAAKNIVAGNNITITSTNSASPATLTRNPGLTGRLFLLNLTSPATATLTIDSVIIDGNNQTANANNQLIYTDGNGNVTLNLTGGTVLKNNNTTSSGSAIRISNANHKLNMTDDTQITNNTASTAGGVYIAGTFAMSGNATISDNRSNGHTGGVTITASGTFTMSGNATISNNTANASGGGVYISGTFTMSGGKISGNTAIVANGGGGVNMVGSAATFTMTGGEISGNTATNGGGVRVDDSSTFIMQGGTISSNTAAYGGGVYVGDGTLGGANLGTGTFTLTNGNITNNIANQNGGGIFTADYGNLTIGASAIFAGNRASFASPTRNPANDAVYAANILSTNWTTPFIQGYNNYDINHDYAPNAPSTGLFGSQISGATISALSFIASGTIIATIFVLYRTRPKHF